MRKLLPLLFLLVATPAFANKVIDSAKLAATSAVGIRATASTTALAAAGDSTTYEVVTPDKLAQYGLTGLKAGSSVRVTVVSDDTVQVAAGERTIKVRIDANGGVALVK